MYPTTPATEPRRGSELPVAEPNGGAGPTHGSEILARATEANPRTGPREPPYPIRVRR